MDKVLLIWATKTRIAAHALADVRNESRLKIGVILFFVILLWGGAFVASYEALGFLKSFDPSQSPSGSTIGAIVMVRMLSLFFMMVFLMLVFSNVLIAFSTLYRTEEVDYLMASPVGVCELFTARFAECLFMSSWAVVFLGTPLMLSYGLVNDAPWFFYLSILLFYLPLAVIPACIGAVIAMLIVAISPQIRGRVFAALVVLTVAALLAYLYRTFNIERLSEAELFLAMLDAMKGTQSPLLPSSWAAEGVLNCAGRNFGRSAFYFGLLVSNALMAFVVTLAVVSKLYYRGYSLLKSTGSRRRISGRGILGRLDWVFGFLRPQYRSLIVKDVRLFWRDATQWSQFVIFFGLMAVYVANLRNVPTYRDSLLWRNATAFLNLSSSALILATLTSRFIFPLISLEGRRFWIVGLAPLARSKLVWQKFWLSVGTCICFTLGLVILSSVILRVEPLIMALSIMTIVLMNFALSGMAVGFGAMYPNFKEDNPARIVSGMGGTLNFLVSIIYIAVTIGVQAGLLQFRTYHFFGLLLAGVIAFVITLSAAATFVPLALGMRALNKADF